MVLAAYSPEGGGNKIKGGIREAEQHKSTGGRRQSNTKVREALPNPQSLSPPSPSLPPPLDTNSKLQRVQPCMQSRR